MKNFTYLLLVPLLLILLSGCTYNESSSVVEKDYVSSFDVLHNDFVKVTYQLEDYNHTIYTEVNKSNEFIIPNPYNTSHQTQIKFTENQYMIHETRDGSAVSYGIAASEEVLDLNNIRLIADEQYQLLLQFEEDPNIGAPKMKTLIATYIVDGQTSKTERIDITQDDFDSENVFSNFKFKISTSNNNCDIKVYEEDDLKEILSVHFNS